MRPAAGCADYWGRTPILHSTVPARRMDDIPQQATLSDSERWLSVIGGGMLILSSLRQRDAGAGGLFALGGSALVFRGIVGHDGFFAAIRNALTGGPGD